MKFVRTDSFRKDFKKLPVEIKNKIGKTLMFMTSGVRHLSLRFKKMEGIGNIWESSITIQYRMTFQLDKDICTLRRIGTHDILRRP